jgi:hypothetical protein
MAANIAMLLTFRLLGFGWNADGILLNPDLQSPKLIAVWTRIKPLPLVVDRPLPIVLGIVALGVAHALLYGWLSRGWPRGVVRRAWRWSLTLFVLSFLFWEFFTPFNQFGEPIPLIAIELSFWAVIALAEGFALAAVYELLRRKSDSP